MPLIVEREGILLVNPGGMGLGDRKKSYAEIMVSGGEVRAVIEEV